jgi:hypothetical protein
MAQKENAPVTVAASGRVSGQGALVQGSEKALKNRIPPGGDAPRNLIRKPTSHLLLNQTGSAYPEARICRPCPPGTPGGYLLKT